MAIDDSTIKRHAFVQAIMARGCMAEDEAKQVYQSLARGSRDSDYLAFLSEVNQQLDFVHFEIRTMTNMFDRSRWVAFVNKVTDEASKSTITWPSSYSPIQLIFFKAIVDRLATDESCGDPGKACISSTDAVNLGLSSSLCQPEGSTQATVRRMTIQEKQDTLNALASDHWLEHHPQISGHFCIGIRTFMEMRAYLLSLDLPEATRQVWEQCM